MTLILNIEADEILYRAAFATEKQGYKLITSKGQIRDFGNHYTKTAILNKIKQLNIQNYELIGYKIVGPLENALYIVKRTIQKLKQIGTPVLWLSPSNGSNFRFKIAKTIGPQGQGYKAGRPPKPIYYNDIRQYLIKYYGATEIEGYEADDALGMYQTDNTVAVHIDKDINMIEGKHLHWISGDRYIVEPGLGQLPIDNERGMGKSFFFHQMLTGDRTDNIPGIAGIGPVKATKLLSKAKNIDEMLAITVEIYYTNYKDEWKDKLIEMANLLYIVDNKNRCGEDYLLELQIDLKQNKYERII